MKTFVLSIFLVSSIFHHVQAQKISFEEINNRELEAVQRADMICEDLDGDGDYDLLICGQTNDNGILSASCKTYVNNGKGEFTELSNPELRGVWQCSIGAADIDLDNDLDVCISGMDSARNSFTDIYFNNGGGVLSKSAQQIQGYMGGDLVFLDANNDGYKDLIISGYGQDMSLYINDSSGFFSTSKVYSFNERLDYNALATADLNGDGSMDVIASGLSGTSSNPTTLVYYGNGNESFNPNYTHGISDMYEGAISVADFNGDTLPDVVISGIKKKATGPDNPQEFISALYLNAGKPRFSFGQQQGNLRDLARGDLDIGDLNSDGFLDVVISGNDDGGSYVVFGLNDGNNVLLEAVEVDGDPISITDGSLCVKDLDGDDLPDLVLCGFNSMNRADVKVYRNKTQVPASVRELNKQGWKIFPNPSNGSFQIESMSEINEATILIHSMDGRFIYQERIYTSKAMINTQLAAGIYSLKMISNNGLYHTLHMIE